MASSATPGSILEAADQGVFVTPHMKKEGHSSYKKKMSKTDASQLTSR